MRQHIEEICRKGNINITYHNFEDSAGSTDGYFNIEISKNDNDTSYIVALHELGHIFGEKQSCLFYSILEREFDAWVWAFNNARYVTDEMICTAIFCFSTYLVDTKKSRKKTRIEKDFLNFIDNCSKRK